MKTKKYRYNPSLKELAKNLRNNSTPGEKILWKYVLRAKKMRGYQFNRQFPIENYIVDFICRKLYLVIEVDGYSHNFKYEEDKIRDSVLENLGFRVLRFSEQEIRNDLNNVIRAIEIIVEEQEKKN